MELPRCLPITQHHPAPELPLSAFDSAFCCLQSFEKANGCLS